MRHQPERVFLFRLAKELGKTVKELCANLDSYELSEWIAFFKYERDLEQNKQNDDLKAKAQAALGGMMKKQ